MKQIFQKRYLIVFLAALLLAYWLLPIFLNAAAKSLIREDPLIKSDIVVALGGDKRCEREKKAAELYHHGYARKIVVHGIRYESGVDTGDAAKRYLLHLGVPENDILINRDTWNTRIEAEYLEKIMRDNGWGSAIIVTSAYHSRRAMFTIERAAPGIRLISAPVAPIAAEWVPDHWWKRRGDMFLTVREFASWANTLLNVWK